MNNATDRGFKRYVRSSDGQVRAVQFGNQYDRAVPGDYDGDGKYDTTVFGRRPARGIRTERRPDR